MAAIIGLGKALQATEVLNKYGFGFTGPFVILLNCAKTMV